MTLKPYKNTQEAFTKAYLGLAAQGFKRSRTVFKNTKFDTAGQVFCAYRAKDEDGKQLKCAIGHLVPDEIINDWVSGRSIGSILLPATKYEHRYTGEWIELFQNCSTATLIDLQHAHDNAETPEDMKDRLANIAAYCEFEIPVIPELVTGDEVGI